MEHNYSSIQINRLDRGVIKNTEDIVIKESALTIYLNNNELVTLLCTPDNLDELTIGFLVSEGLIKTPEDITKVRLEKDKGLIWVEADKTDTIAQKLFLKRYITTGCGKGTMYYNIMDSALVKQAKQDWTMSVEEVFSLMHKVQESSDLYRATGGVHGAAMAEGDQILFFREDVGRHNAVDKLLGRCFLDKINFENKVLLTSGRISSEILLKVAKRGIGILISRSAPTDLAVKLAAGLGITIIGFVRGTRMNIYTHQERVVIE